MYPETAKIGCSHLTNKERFMEIKTRRGIMRGVLHMSKKRSPPLVIIIHGYFSSDKIGPARLYVQIARALAATGLHVLRFDFTGFGESDGEMESVTLDSELEDGQTVISYMKKLGYKSGIILLGHSFGSNLSILLAERCNEVVKVVGISPVYEKNSEHKYLDSDQIRRLNETGIVSRKGFIVNKRFIESLDDAPGFAANLNIKVAVTIIRGGLDEFYTSKGISKVIDRFPNWRLVEIEGADHNFLNSEARTKLLDTIVTELRDYHK